MLGDQINDVPDISIAINNLKKCLKENKFHKDKHIYLQKIQEIQKLLNSDIKIIGQNIHVYQNNNMIKDIIFYQKKMRMEISYLIHILLDMNLCPNLNKE